MKFKVVERMDSYVDRTGTSEGLYCYLVLGQPVIE